MFAVRIYPAMSRSIVMNISFFATLHTAHDQQQCSDAVLFQPWDDVWLVRYNKWPCNPNWPWAAFCEDSGWGDEEATVVCREQGFLYGTGGECNASQQGCR